MRYIVLLFGLLLIAQSGSSLVGEHSRSVAETRQAVARSPVPWTPPNWSITTGGPAIAVDEIARAHGIVAFPVDGRICGMSDADGRRIWCSGAGSHPVAAGARIVFASASGTIRAVAAMTGAPVWEFTFPAYSTAGGDRISGLWSAGNDVFTGFNSNRAASSNYGELDAAGRLLWSSTIKGSLQAAVVAGPYLLQAAVGSGASMQFTEQIFASGKHGGPRFAIGDSIGVVAVRGNIAYVLVAQPTATLHQLTFEIRGISLRDGSSVSDYDYAPDADVNAALLDDGTVRGDAPTVAIVNNYIYGSVGPKLYQYVFASADRQRPLLLSTTGMFLAAGANGVFVARRDGVWMLTPRLSDILARLVAPSAHAPSSFVRSDGTLFVAFDDGEIRGIDVASGMTGFRAHGCVHPKVRAIGDELFVACSATRSTLAVFPI